MYSNYGEVILSNRIKNKYANDNLLPIAKSEKNWSSIHFVILWFGLVTCVIGCMFVGNLIAVGFNWWQALLVIFLGNFLVYLIVASIGVIGTKYGISFPVLLRCSFGLKGAKFAAILRALLACGWFSILTWQGSRCLLKLFEVLLPGLKYFKGDVFGCDILQFFCLVVLILLQIYIACGGMSAIIKLQFIFVSLMIIAIIIVILSYYIELPEISKALTATQILPSKNLQFKTVATMFVSTVAVWSTLAMSICDFTRYAKNQKSQIVGQFIGFPLGILIVTFVGIFITGTYAIIYGKIVWDPIVLFESITNPFYYFLSYFIMLLAVLSTNMAANVVPMANTISCLFPKLFSFKISAILACMIGVLFLPLQLMNNAYDYILLWLIAYSTVTGAISGIIISDYYLVRKRIIKIKALYKSGSEYNYHKGWNIIGITSLFVAILPSMPGFFLYAGLISSLGKLSQFFELMYRYSWFTAFIIAIALYYILMKYYYLKKMHKVC